MIDRCNMGTFDPQHPQLTVHVGSDHLCSWWGLILCSCGFTEGLCGHILGVKGSQQFLEVQKGARLGVDGDVCDIDRRPIALLGQHNLSCYLHAEIMLYGDLCNTHTQYSELLSQLESS